MKVYKNTRSAKIPENIVIDEYSVWVHKDIQKIEDKIGENTNIEYEYTMIQYSKDEYIKMMQEQLTNTELALVEIYEGVNKNA